MIRNVVRPTSKFAGRAMSSKKFTLPELTYDYAELEPFISAEIMNIHHTKHHNTYVTNLNTMHEKLEDAVAKGDVNQIVTLQQGIKFNGGGHINHTIFFKNLAPPKKGGGQIENGDLLTMINAQYGSLEALQTTMSSAAVGVQGSGWGWLGYDKNNKKLHVTTTSNQDPLQPTTGLVPLLGIDVWEHAYYLQVRVTCIF
jgi:Fe-Mn family superoxide dismutase